MADNKEQEKLLRDIELLDKYLTEKLMKEQKLKYKEAHVISLDIISKNQGKLFGYHGLAWELGKSLEFFCLYFLQDLYFGEGKSPLSKNHYEIWQELEDMILKKDYNQRNYICPRGFGKTTCISTPIAIWSHCYGYKKYTVIASAIGDTAEEFLKNIKNNIEGNKYIEKSFGKLIDSKKFTCNSEKIEFTNKTMIQSISASGAIRGKNYNGTRIELLILDDYQKLDEVSSEEATEKKWKVFNEDAKNAMQKSNTTMLAVGTIQRKTCFYSRLINSATWKSKVKRALNFDIDEYFNDGLWEEFYKLLMNTKDDNRLDTAKEFYFQNKQDMQFPMLWSEYWNCLDFALLYFEDKQGFKQEYQNDLSGVGERRFKSIATETNEEIENHNFEKTILVCDPANTRTKTSKKDYFAFSLTSTCTDNKFKYIRKGEIHKFTKNREYEDYIEHTLFLLRKYKDITHLCIEKNTYGGADCLKIQELIKEDKELKNRRLEIIPYYQNSNKDDKIQTIVGAVNLGQIVFNDDDAESIDQLREFTSCKLVAHDDFPDVVAQACKMIDEIQVIRELRVFDIRKMGL